MLHLSQLHRSLSAAGLAGALLAVAPAVMAAPDASGGPAGPMPSRPLAWEFNWTPLRAPDGSATGLLGGSVMVAVNEDWGVGPTVYGAAKGDLGGLFVYGMTAQRRWRLGSSSHLAASLFAGGGGGRSSDTLRFGGGLMLRPELSVRTEFGRWYAGVGVSHLRFTGGNLRGSQVNVSFGRMGLFDGLQVGDGATDGSLGMRAGLGFDEVSLISTVYKPAASQRLRSGRAMSDRVVVLGADLRQYFAPGAWLGLEASGAAKGGIDGYMEILAVAGQDWEIGNSGIRLGGQLGLGLAGGGDVATGSGWMWRVGPSLRWQLKSGPALRLEAGKTWTRGTFSAPHVRASISMPLEPLARRSEPEALLGGQVHEQALYASLQRFSSLGYKDGSREPMTQQGLIMTRSLGEHLYGVAQAGAAVQGKAGAYAYGLFGLGLRSGRLWDGQWRVGAEALVGAGGGGGVALGGGAMRQTEAWLQWQGRGELAPLRVRVGYGQAQSLRGHGRANSQLNLAVGYAWGSL